MTRRAGRMAAAHRAQQRYRLLLADAVADGDAWLSGRVAPVARASVLLDRHGRFVLTEGAHL